ncbi:MAG: leucine-rich repeat domain-containing protein, partial [Bacteroidaceae bacterium]|nr:leucine-rich repeat domain-containing protein [Bacteroidaceae bacterium]
MKKICIFSIFAFIAVSIGMHAQTQKTLSFGDPDDPDESYSGYTINLSGSGALATFLESASPEVKSAEYIEIKGATLNEDDVLALSQLNAKFIDLDACTFTDNSLASSITASTNIEAMSLPAGLTKEQVNAAGAKLAGVNTNFGSVASIIGTNEVACYAHTPGTLYEANTLAEAKESLKWVISGNITLEDLCGGISGHADPGTYLIAAAYKFSKTVDTSHYAWGSNSPTSIDLSGVTTIDDYKYLRILKKYSGSVEELSFSPNITTIPEECCQWYEKLKSVVIPEGVETIEKHAFGACPLLEYVHIPSTIELVETETFLDCTKLYYLDFAQGIETLDFEENVFKGCTGL